MYIWIHTPLELKMLPEFWLKFFGLNSCGLHSQNLRMKLFFEATQGRGGKKDDFPFCIIYSTLDSLFIYILYIFMPFLTLKNFNFRRAEGWRRQSLLGQEDGGLNPSKENPSVLAEFDWLLDSQNKSPCQSQVNSQVSIVSRAKKQGHSQPKTSRDTFFRLCQDVWHCKWDFLFCFPRRF